MTKPIDRSPRKLLSQVLKLMENDIDEIEKLSEAGKLDGEVSSCLVRYSDALLKIVKDADAQEELQRQQLNKMSTEELAAKAQEYLNKVKPKV